MSKRKWVPLYTAALLLFASVATASVAKSERLEPQPAMTALQAQLDVWLGELSALPDFADWRAADRHISPLGPGTHGWLVVLRSGERPLGYMIAYAVAGGDYSLGEYGRGDPLFDEAALGQALRSPELDSLPLAPQAEPRYISPLLAVWRVPLTSGSAVYVDAYSEELLPLSDETWQQAATAAQEQLPAGHPERLTRSGSVPAFDVYERMPWLTSEPLASSAASIQEQLDQGASIWYTADPFDGLHLYIYGVAGYHDWDGELYVALDADSPRYIPFATLATSGHYYR